MKMIKRDQVGMNQGKSECVSAYVQKEKVLRVLMAEAQKLTRCVLLSSWLLWSAAKPHLKIERRRG